MSSSPIAQDIADQYHHMSLNDPLMDNPHVVPLVIILQSDQQPQVYFKWAMVGRLVTD